MNLSNNLLQKLRQWRDRQARIEGVEGYRVLPNQTLELIAESLPHSQEELCDIKGIKDAKFRKYGKEILKLVSEEEGQDVHAEIDFTHATEQSHEQNTIASRTLTVSQFLDGLNLELSGMAARIQGEVTSVDVRERVVYFSLKDKEDESILSCLMFRYQYELSGVSIEVGMEIVVEGVPDVYKPSGRLSVRAGSVEYAGEGALKQAYLKLYQLLADEGVFSPENKKPIPAFPRRVALITSQDGAAIGDFTSNLVRAGIKVDFYPTLVEGKKAVFDIIRALEYFNQKSGQYDVLVLIRGGGSFESLQAFNTESLVRAVYHSKIPVLAGIGHERDISLAALAADRMVSTPTATAKELSQSYDMTRESMEKIQAWLLMVSERVILQGRALLDDQERLLRGSFDTVFERFMDAKQSFEQKALFLPEHIRMTHTLLTQRSVVFITKLQEALNRTNLRIEHQTRQLTQYDPARVLQLGYSLVRKNGRVIRQSCDLSVGDMVRIQLGRGALESEIKQIYSEEELL